MNDTVILRSSDAGRMCDLHAEAFDEAEAWSVSAFEDLLVLKSTLAIGIERLGELKAFILIQKAGDTAEILTLAVSPDAQRRGLARELFEAASALLSQRLARRFLLDVAADNVPAITLYKSLGFSEDGRRPGYYKRRDLPRVDAILMSRRVAGHGQS